MQLELLAGLGAHGLGHARVGVDEVGVAVGEDLFRRHGHLGIVRASGEEMKEGTGAEGREQNDRGSGIDVCVW